MWYGLGGASTGSTKPLPPEANQCRGPQQGFVPGRQEQAVGVAPALRPVRPIRWRNEDTVAGCVDLDHPVQVADIDPKLQRTGRHDHAILPLGKSLFSLVAFLDSQGTVGDEGLDGRDPKIRSCGTMLSLFLC